jgi:hypothetical protein
MATQLNGFGENYHLYEDRYGTPHEHLQGGDVDLSTFARNKGEGSTSRRCVDWSDRAHLAPSDLGSPAVGATLPVPGTWNEITE